MGGGHRRMNVLTKLELRTLAIRAKLFINYVIIRNLVDRL